jgi:hypothetical protein
MRKSPKDLIAAAKGPCGCLDIADPYIEFVNGSEFVKLNGEYSADELRAIADWMDGKYP